MKKLKGYIFSRPFLGERVPQHIQNIILRNYCKSKNINFLLSSTEYTSEGSSLILFEVLKNIKKYDGILFYSLLQLPLDQKKRQIFYKNILKNKKELHFACENIKVKTKNEIKNLDLIFKINLEKNNPYKQIYKKGVEKFYVNYRHKKSKRNFIERLTNNKVKCMKVAKKYDYNYWDGDRKFGYGGYKYIEGYHHFLAKNLVKDYNLNQNSKILDIGCGKGFLMYELKKITKSKFIYGIDISKYGIKNSKKEIKKNITHFDARKKLNYDDNYFDLAITINTFHNFKLPEINLALKEIERIAINKYLCVESYRNEAEQFGAQSWALTAETIIDKKSWKWLFENSGYKGDYEFIYFK